MRNNVDISEILQDLGFIVGFRGDAGYTVLEHPDLMIEFLVAEKRKGDLKPKYIDRLGVTPQAVRYVGMLDSNPIELTYGDIVINVPHPVNFALHKILLSTIRKQKAKADVDRMQGIKLLKDLLKHGDKENIKSEYEKLKRPWKLAIRRSMSDSPDADILKEITGRSNKTA